MADQQEEAAQSFDQVVNDMMGQARDLKSALRRCQHACKLAGWSDQQEWFRRELAGYTLDVDVPSHRIVTAYFRWQVQGTSYRALQTSVSRAISNETSDEVQEAEEPIRIGIDGLLAGQAYGYSQGTGHAKPAYDALHARRYTLEWTKTIPPTAYTVMLSLIEQYTFDFASTSYHLLRYGNALTDIWTGYRTATDEALRKLNLTNHLDVVQKGLQSDNPESWRIAVYGCRNMLDDLANHLWCDERPTYEYLSASKGGKMEVKKGMTKNRLKAYLHQKGVSGGAGGFLRDEVDRLDASLRSLYEVANSAHGSMSLERARTVALSTYFLIGELAQRTDMQPVETYGLPAVAADKGQH